METDFLHFDRSQELVLTDDRGQTEKSNPLLALVYVHRVMTETKINVGLYRGFQVCREQQSNRRVESYSYIPR